MRLRLASCVVAVACVALLCAGFGSASAQMGFGFGGGGFGGFGGFGRSGGGGFGRQGGGFGGAFGGNRGNGGFGAARGNGGGAGRMGQGPNAGGRTGGFGRGNGTGQYQSGAGGRASGTGGYGRPQRDTGGYGRPGRPQGPYGSKTRPPYGPVTGQRPPYRPPHQAYHPPRLPRVPIVPLPVAPPVVAAPSGPPPGPPGPPRPVMSGGGGGPPPRTAAAPPRPTQNLPPAGETRYVENEILVRTGAQTAPDQIARIEQQYRLTPLGTTRIGLLDADLRRYRVADGTSVPAALQALGGEAVTAQPNYLFDLQDSVKFNYQAPGDQAPGNQTPAAPQPAPPEGAQSDPATLATTTPSAPVPQPSPSDNVAVEPPPQYAIETMRLATAHKVATGANVLIAVIDTGLDESHPEIEGSVVDRFDPIDGTFAPNAHGTGMAGVIVAHRSLVGIAPNAKLLAIRAFASMARGARGNSYDIVRGLDFAAERNARIINLSFAGPRDPLLAEALAKARARGMIAVAAAGNAGPTSPPLYPAAEPGVIAITATDTQNNVYAKANRGGYVVTAAPGVDVIAPSIGGGVQLSSGTSIAAAEASGVIALLLQDHPNMDADSVRKILGETATRAPDSTVIDASAAVQAAAQ